MVNSSILVRQPDVVFVSFMGLYRFDFYTALRWQCIARLKTPEHPIIKGITMIKLLSTSIAMAFLSGGLSASPTQDSPLLWLSFNSSAGDVLSDETGWFHREPGASGCAAWGPTQSALCKGDNARLHWYYNGSNSDHMGWLRYGAMKATHDLAMSGSSMTLLATGGATRDPVSKDIVVHGHAITRLSELVHAENNVTTGVYSDVRMPGSIPLYYKNTNSTDTIPEFKDKNRLTQWIWLPADPERRKRHSRGSASTVRPDKTVAWYPFLDSSKGGHYYHHITNRASGGWVMAQWDAHPTHHNGGPYPENHAFTEGGRDAPLDGAGYFSRIAAFSMVYHTASNAVSPYRVTTDDWSLFYRPYENEETINNLAIGFDPEFQDFDISFEDKYRCANCHARYELWFSFSPISLSTLNQASQIVHVENFFVEDDNSQGHIVKPNTYYNQIWARFALPADALARHKSGESVYFAVRDISNRGALSDAADTSLIELPDGTSSQRQDLLKTIKYARAISPTYPAIQAEAHYRITEGGAGSLAINATQWQNGWQWAVEQKPNLNATISSQSANSTIQVNSIPAGEHLLSVRLRDATGTTLARHTFTLIARESDCRQLSDCPHYTLVSFGNSEKTHDKPSAQWRTVIRDVYTNAVSEGGMGIIVGSNGGYQFAGIKGDPFMVGQYDVLTFTVKNTTSASWSLAPKLSLTSEARANVSPSEWISLPSRMINPGETVRFEVPASALPQATFNLININLPVNSQGILLKAIGIYSDKAMLCNGCGTTLIDFYHNDGQHSMPYADWQTAFKDVYTGQVGERGSGIVIGSNGSYNYQGVKGTLPLPDGASNIVLRWRNLSEQTFRFSPKISFNDPDRVNFGEVGEWFTLEEISVGPGETVIQYVPLPEGDITMVNVSSYVNQQKMISLSRIALD